MAPTEEDVAVDEEVRIQEEQDVEVEPLRAARDPGQPTASQVEMHRRTHLPYRLWCKWCILGRGRGLQHRRSHGSIIPIIGLDYFFITKGGVRRRGELDYAADKDVDDARSNDELVKCLVVRCSSPRIVFGHVAPCKGADEDGWVADTVVQDVAWLGHTKVILKADGEAAIQALARRVL